MYVPCYGFAGLVPGCLRRNCSLLSFSVGLSTFSAFLLVPSLPLYKAVKVMGLSKISVFPSSRSGSHHIGSQGIHVL